MKTIIIEDEKIAADRLKRIIANNHPNYEVLKTLDTVRDSVQYLSTHHDNLDLIFCDIHLADGNSFEIFKKLKCDVPIIFTTAYDEYTLDAFDVNSLHYLLKPIDQSDLAKAILKFEKTNSENSDIKTILDRFGPEKTKRFLLKSGQRLIPKKESELAIFYSKNKVVHAADLIEGKVYVTDFTLEQLEQGLLSQRSFFRINRKHIVNKEAITALKPYKNQRLSLSLAIPSSEELVLSREKVNPFKEWFIA
ncbi:LytR/AlgR family response regulator transcription factor [Ekhidna sp.]|uniref:LytR/AlgR family response regulator transcription factor n=1 Tax=Ekhidna sp. TaxID=2608089 RepID=UPI003C7C96B3